MKRNIAATVAYIPDSLEVSPYTVPHQHLETNMGAFRIIPAVKAPTMNMNMVSPNELPIARRFLPIESAKYVPATAETKHHAFSMTFFVVSDAS
jgi:hypothetical protein